MHWLEDIGAVLNRIEISDGLVVKSNISNLKSEI